MQRLGEHLGVFDDGPGVELEFRSQRLAERDRFCCNHMHQRPALQAREYGRIDLLPEVRIARQDHAAARTAQRLVRRRRHHMGVIERSGVHAARDESGKVRHVDHEVGADGIGDLPGSARSR